MSYTVIQYNQDFVEIMGMESACYIYTIYKLIMYSYDDFDDGIVSSYDVDISNDETFADYYVSGEEGKLAVHMGGGSYYWIRVSKEFNPVVTGTLVTEFTLSIPEGSYMLNYRGFPIYIDMNGNEIGMIKIWGNSDIRINDVEFKSGQEYRCKVELNLDTNLYKFYVDSSNGYIQKSTKDGKNEFEYQGNGVTAVAFSCETYPDSPNLIYLDDIYIHKGQRCVFVSPDGNDSNNGDYKTPFATVNRAMYEEDAVIVLKKGTHYFDDTFTYGPVDINETPNVRVMIPMYEDGITLSGDYKTQNIPETARDKVKQINLRSIGISSYGDVLYTSDTPGAEIFSGEKVMTQARWPNGEYAKIGTVLSQYPITFTADERVSNWIDADNAYIEAFWGFDWDRNSKPISSIDTSSNTVTVSGTESYTVLSGQRYFVHNLIEELDSPGEYYINRDGGILYFYPESDLSNIRISVLEEPFIVGTNLSNLRCIYEW